MSSVANNNWSTGITWKAPLPTPIGAQCEHLSLEYHQMLVVVTAYATSSGVIDADNRCLTMEPYPDISSHWLTRQFCMQSVPDFVVLDPVASTFKCYSMKLGLCYGQVPASATLPWATTWTVYWSDDQ